jgi:hypothetical protein
MKTKFEQISDFVDSLENNVISEKEQSYLLVGGNGLMKSTNNSCENAIWCEGDNSGECRNNGICF